MKVRAAIATALITTAILGFIWPFLVPSKEVADVASWFFLGSTALSLLALVFLVRNEDLSSKDVAFLGILTALVAALRPLGIGAIGIEPMWFALILAARVMGPIFGFMLGASSMFLSALLTGGVGPWLGYQVFAAAIIGSGVALIPSRVRGKGELALLAIYGVCAAELFGIMMDLQFWPWSLGSGTELSYVPGGDISTNISHFVSYHFISALAWDIPRATITAALVAIAGKPVLNALRRARTKAAFLPASEFSKLTNV